ncbi:MULTISPECIES: hypothetical protein [unclassified Streptomyces]|uniref:hypothetical protein n=1 Tax=unclassified Streptomyces TaxID=2593676 RepID=UPI0035DCE06E
MSVRVAGPHQWPGLTLIGPYPPDGLSSGTYHLDGQHVADIARRALARHVLDHRGDLSYVDGTVNLLRTYDVTACWGVANGAGSPGRIRVIG